MPSTVIAERIGWTRGITILKERVAELRPAYLPPDPASRTAYAAGEIGQCDLWFPPIRLPVGYGQVRRPAELPVLTMISGYSRWLSAVLIPSRVKYDLFAGWWQLIGGLGATPKVLVWDARASSAFAAKGRSASEPATPNRLQARLAGRSLPTSKSPITCRTPRVAFKVIAGPVRPIGCYEISGDNPTTVTFTLDVALTGIRKALMASIVQKTMDTETRALDRAKDRLE